MVPLEKNFAQIDAKLQQAMKDVVLPRTRQGAVFHEGQHVECNGGKFVVKKIIKKGLVLHGAPTP